MTSRGLCSASERGTITILFTILAVFFFGIVSLVSEGGRKLSNVGRAEDVAAEAARSAAATLNLDAVANGLSLIDEVDDRARLQAEIIVEGVAGARIEEFVVSGESVVVVVRISARSWIPGFNIDGVGSHRAVAIDPLRR